MLELKQILAEHITIRILTELSDELIKRALLNALAREKEQIMNNDIVGAVKTGKRFVSVHSRLQNR